VTAAAVRAPRYARLVERTITDYHEDDAGDWVAELSCGHDQHVRHRPPFQLRTWALENEGRTAKLGTPIDCPLCERAELPDGVRLLRTSPEWNEHTIPAGLLSAHRLAKGTWGRIAVRRRKPEIRRVHRTADPDCVGTRCDPGHSSQRQT